LRVLRNILRVALYELSDAVRSKRFAVVLVLYVLGSGAACFVLISILHKVEIELAGMLGLSASASPGAVADALWNSDTFRRMATHLVGDKAVAKELLSIPPLALVYGWLAFTFTPILVMLSCPSRIAEEVTLGSARFSLVRVSRTEWCVGKYIGQALEIIVPLMLSAVSAWVVASFRLQSMAGGNVIWSMIVYGWRVWFYCLAFVGIGLGVSQVCRSANQATAFSLIVWVLLAVLRGLSGLWQGDGWRRIWHVIPMMTPAGHKLDLWRLSYVNVVPAALYVVTIGLVFFCIGHAIFLRRDI
jgi:ABC-type transport system involved in multi-copper enzyme maturation permease subunit